MKARAFPLCYGGPLPFTYSTRTAQQRSSHSSPARIIRTTGTTRLPPAAWTSATPLSVWLSADSRHIRKKDSEQKTTFAEVAEDAQPHRATGRAGLFPGLLPG